MANKNKFAVFAVPVFVIVVLLYMGWVFDAGCSDAYSIRTPEWNACIQVQHKG
jgi:hypothetical protein